jgi:hypothetical protein
MPRQPTNPTLLIAMIQQSVTDVGPKIIAYAK